MLAALALKPETTDAARYALERIPGERGDWALVEGLGKAAGVVRRGIVFSLGERKTAAAVPVLTGLAAGKDAALAADAVKALGKIGGPEAVKTLTAMLGKAGATLKPEAASALLLAAEGLLAAGDKTSAATVYDKVFAANVTPVSRQAAFKGKLAVADDAKSLILKTLGGKDALLFAPALAAVPANYGEGEISQVGDLMLRLPVVAIFELAGILAGYPADAVRPYLLSAAENPSSDVRLAALRSIAAAGDGKSIDFSLATKAARSAGAEQDAAREALARLRGSDVDEAILAHLAKTSDDAVKAEAFQRPARGASPGPSRLSWTSSKPARPLSKAKAAAALRTVAGEEDLPGVVRPSRLARRRGGPRSHAGYRRGGGPHEPEGDGPLERRQIAARGREGRGEESGPHPDPASLATTRPFPSSGERCPIPTRPSSTRPCARWPTGRPSRPGTTSSTSPRTSIVLNHRILSIRAYIRMIGLEPNRLPEGAAADLLKVLSVSTRPEEKKLVLGLLGRFPCVTSLKTAESLLADPTVEAEAKLAADPHPQSFKNRGLT